MVVDHSKKIAIIDSDRIFRITGALITSQISLKFGSVQRSGKIPSSEQLGFMPHFR
jgi:hypothetical protein